GGRFRRAALHAAGAATRLIAATISESAVRSVYLMPTFHNPAGSVMPGPARRELARFCRASEVPIIEDNTLAELALGCEPPPPVAAYGRDAHVVSIGRGFESLRARQPNAARAEDQQAIAPTFDTYSLSLVGRRQLASVPQCFADPAECLALVGRSYACRPPK